MSARNELFDSDTALARFGDARVVLNEHHRLELVGGTEQERSEALEWLAMFLPVRQCATLAENVGVPMPYELWSLSTL